jgi:hypothetical protein
MLFGYTLNVFLYTPYDFLAFGCFLEAPGAFVCALDAFFLFLMHVVNVYTHEDNSCMHWSFALGDDNIGSLKETQNSASL